MRKGIVIVLIAIVVVVAVVVGVVSWRDSQTRYDVAQTEVLPTFVFREEPPREIGAETSEEMRLLEDLRPLMATKAQEEPETETVFVSEPETPASGEKALRAKLGPWEYRSFMDFAGVRIAVFENPKTGEAIQVREGSELEGLLCRKLTQSTCELALGDEFITVSLTAAPEPTQPPRPQPPDRRPRPPAPPAPPGSPEGGAVEVVPSEPSDQPTGEEATPPEEAEETEETEETEIEDDPDTKEELDTEEEGK